MSGSKPLAMWTGGQYRYRRFKTIDTTDMPNDQWVRFSNWVESYGPTVAGERSWSNALRHDQVIPDTVQHVDADRPADDGHGSVGCSP